MFRRKRASSNPPVNTNPNSAAATAAAQAFLANRASNANLAASAAGAALRSHTTSPIPVSQVQTKRTLQRQASTSSNGSAPNPGRGPAGRGLQRQNSSGSMTERTFRDPSPNRGGPRAATEVPPPVPALPKNIPPMIPPKSSRRASSLEPRLRISSPPPKSPSGRGVSVDRGPGPSMGNSPAGHTRVGSLTSVQELERTDSMSSVNFSKPFGARNTPPASPTTEKRVMSPVSGDRRPGSPLARPGSPVARVTSPVQRVTSPVQRVSSPVQRVASPATKSPTPMKGLNVGETSRIMNALQETASQPVKKKKKVVAKEMAQGSHLTGGASGGRPTGTAGNNTVPSREQTRSPQPATILPPSLNTESANTLPRPKKKKTKVISPAEQPPSNAISYSSDLDSGSESAISTPDHPKSFTTRAAGMLAKQPSIVREDKELEEQAEKGGRVAVLPRIDTSGSNNVVAPKKAPAAANSSKEFAENKRQRRSTSQPAPHLAANPAPFSSSTLKPDGNIGRGQGSLRNARPQSLSPARSAHFSSQTTEFNGTRHQPPPRSLSPAKSALKHSPSPRARSPVANLVAGVGRGSGQTPSEASDATSTISEDGPKKKKSARVSFDEGPVNVGRAVSPPTSPDTPVIQSPQSKDTATRNWLGLGRGKKMDEVPSKSGQQQADENMQPRPALPSFGSAQGRLDRNTGERTVPKPAEQPVENPRENGQVHGTDSTSFGRAVLDRINMSSDQGVGGVLSQDFASKSTSNISEDRHASIEQPLRNNPLPPEATSVEGAGYDTDGSVYSVEDGKRRSMQIDPNHNEHVASYRALASPSPPSSDNDGDRGIGWKQEIAYVPSISVVQATPTLNDTAGRDQWLGAPGSYPPSENSLSEGEAGHHVVAHHPTDPTPASLGLAEPEPEEAAASHQSGSPMVGGLAEGLRLQTEHIKEEEEELEDDDNNSIYSDAAEDLSDVEGDGFGSINAIVESPAVGPVPGLALTTPPDSPTKQLPAQKGYQKSKLSRQDSEQSEPAVEEGWDKAQAYWSNLSERRKQQLEREAMSEGEEDIAEPVQPKPKAKTKTKKKVVPKAASTQQITSTDSPLPPWPDQQFRDSMAPSTTPSGGKLKSSMRATPQNTAEEPHMRKSMRNEGSMRSSMRGPPVSSPRQSVEAPHPTTQTPPPRQPKAVAQKKARPVSAAPLLDHSSARVVTATPNQHTRNFSNSTTASSNAPSPIQPTKKAPAPASGLRRVVSNGSDSSSSFKKARPSSVAGGYTMRSSMRGGPEPKSRGAPDRRPASPEPSATKSSRFSIRSLSPTGSTARKSFNPPPSSGGGMGMRSSMRGSMDSTTPSLRGKPKERPQSPIRLFGKSSKEKPLPSKPKSKFSSRFGDSSDDEDGPSGFRSRFNDSSDEDEPIPKPMLKSATPLTPVRGIPKRIGEEDKESTDLDDSSEDGGAAPFRNEKPPIAHQHNVVSHEGTALATGSLRDNDPNRDFGMGTGLHAKKEAEKEKKRSFFGGFGSKKKDGSKVQQLGADESTRRQQPPPPPDRIRSDLQQQAPPPSTAKVNGVGSPKTPKSPKLQRRNTPKSFAAESWPLPPPPPLPGMNGNNNNRPSTADGAVSKSPALNNRPDLGDRRATMPPTPVDVEKRLGTAETAANGATATTPEVAVTEKPVKKKKFQGLRRVFGRHD
ncbi:MAG: hypothetical protein M1827_004786 [Pycnora praestabilis]|nr:MAG: hypothetical protein M1827_004786 [Pycnora praestabilis]